MSEKQATSFQDRVERINTRAQEAKKHAPKRKGDTIWTRLAYPAAFIGAFALGVGAFFFSRFLQLKLAGLPGEAKGSGQDFIGLALAGGVVFLISFLLKNNQKEFATMSAFAMIVTTFTFHNAVWAYPDAFEVVYGPEWVEFVQQQTEPRSLQVFHIAIEFD